MKPERYKVKSISEIIENSAIISGLNKADKMEIIDLQNKTKQEIINILDNAFSIKERKSFLLGYSDIYGDNKRIFLSTSTIQSHYHHSNITAYDYSMVIDILKGKIHKFNDKKDKRVIIILAHYNGKNYRLVTKNIPNKDEVFIQSLSNIGHSLNEIKRVIKKARNKG